MAGGNRRNIVAALAALLMLSACGGAPPPPAVVQLSLAAGPNINPDGMGHPSPVQVRVFQLASPYRFERADFFQLADNERAALGTDLINRDSVIIPPGRTNRLTIQMKHGADYLGIAASFRDIDKAKWRAVVPIPASGKVAIAVTIRGLSLTAAASSP
ncbi:MAG: type VI secretion system lipoprotein TssJ [Stellaceae bacterium]